MGNSVEEKSCEAEKPSLPMQDQTNIHLYPDWAAMQAYYGHQVAVPPYFNPAGASVHSQHPYMWAPQLQPIMPPFSPPYAAVYAHGGVFTHPGMPSVATSLSMDITGKSSENTDQRVVKELKVIDGAKDGICHGLFQSGETESSTNGSDDSPAVVKTGREGKKGNHAGELNIDGNGKADAQNREDPVTEVNGTPERMTGVNVASVCAAHEVMGSFVHSTSMTTALELRNSSTAAVRSNPISVPQPSPKLQSEVWIKNERELKRERRKQSNRESARRSRMRKQAETEELATKVESLAAENATLRFEIKKFHEDIEKLKDENTRLMKQQKRQC